MKRFDDQRHTHHPKIHELPDLVSNRLEIIAHRSAKLNDQSVLIILLLCF